MKNTTKSFLSVLATALFLAALVTVWRGAVDDREGDLADQVAGGLPLVPAAIALDSVRFTGDGTLHLRGTATTRYDAALRERLEPGERGVSFADPLPGSVRIVEATETWLFLDGEEAEDPGVPAGDDEEGAEDLDAGVEQPVDELVQVLTERFELEVPLAPDRTRFPFDRLECLRLRPVALSSGAQFDPLRTTVVGADAAPPGWTLLGGRFVDPAGDGNPATYQYALSMRRLVVGPLLRDLAPLAVVFGLITALVRALTATTTARPSSSKPSGSATSAVTTGAGLTLVVFIAHALLRAEVEAHGIVYGETFHLVAYVAIVAVALAASGSRATLAYLQLLLWPLVGGLSLVAALVFLPGWEVSAGSALVPLGLAGSVCLLALLFLGRGSGPTGPAPDMPPAGPVHFLTPDGKIRCGRESSYATDQRDRVTCRHCLKLMYEDEALPEPLDSFPE